jgi:hypothetical protein
MEIYTTFMWGIMVLLIVVALVAEQCNGRI